jgi:hypothetical protein
MAYTNIPEAASFHSARIYKTTGGVREEAQILNYSDTDGNGLIDRVYWWVPHLSTQTCEIILISRASHLDGNREFIEDAYPAVAAIGGQSIEIPEGHYLRVTFEEALDSEAKKLAGASASPIPQSPRQFLPSRRRGRRFRG